MKATLHRSIKDNRQNQNGRSYLIYKIAGHKVVVKPDDYDLSSFPIWEAWESGKKKETYVSVRGSAFDSVDDCGYIYQEPALVAEYVALREKWIN